MFFTADMKNLPFKPDTRQIIYVENQFDEAINTLIQIHFLDIYYKFDARGYEFCYLPWQTRQIEEGEEGRYFTPYRDKSDQLVIKSNFLLDYMVHPENRKDITPSLLYYDPACNNDQGDETVCRFSGITLSKDSFEWASDLSTVLEEIVNDIDSHREGGIRFQKTPSIESEDDDEDEILYRLDEEDDFGFRCHEDDHDLKVDADALFDTESKLLMGEILLRIEKLNRKGIDTYIIQQMIKSKDDKLSRLLITKDYRIILKDYNDMEIKMTPLPKALFLLFLKHQEGIILKHLPDYAKELNELYKKVKPTYSFDSYSSISKVTDPTANSINENIARIRAAFVSQFHERLAKHYYVVGNRGEAKKIDLPRELVIWEE